MCYQFHRTHDRARRLFRQSLAYEHAIQSLELVEAHAGEWVQLTSQGSHLFEPIISMSMSELGTTSCRRSSPPSIALPEVYVPEVFALPVVIDSH